MNNKIENKPIDDLLDCIAEMNKRYLQKWREENPNAESLWLESKEDEIANQNVFNAENYQGSKEHFNDIANGRD